MSYFTSYIYWRNIMRTKNCLSCTIYRLFLVLIFISVLQFFEDIFDEVRDLLYRVRQGEVEKIIGPFMRSSFEEQQKEEKADNIFEY